MATADITPTVIVAVCPTCMESRYRSKVPIGKPEDCKASNFAPLGEAPELPDGSAPVCHVCGAMLKFTTENNLKPKAEANAKNREQARQEATNVGGSYSGVQTLFEVRPGETVKDISVAGPAVIVITDKRIVRVEVA